MWLNYEGLDRKVNLTELGQQTTLMVFKYQCILSEESLPSNFRRERKKITKKKRDGEKTFAGTREIRGTAKIFESGVRKVKLIRVWTLNSSCH